MPIPADDLPLRPVDDDILEKPPLEVGGLGEFTETLIDADGQLDPEVLEEENSARDDVPSSAD